MFREHERIVLITDILEEGLVAGDVGTIVHIHPREEAFVVEFMALDGNTIAIATVLPSQARLVTDKDITHAREMTMTD